MRKMRETFRSLLFTAIVSRALYKPRLNWRHNFTALRDVLTGGLKNSPPNIRNPEDMRVRDRENSKREQ